MVIKTGRPKVTARPGFSYRFGDILERLASNQVSRNKAAKELGIGYATLKRLLDSNYHGTDDGTAGSC